MGVSPVWRLMSCALLQAGAQAQQNQILISGTRGAFRSGEDVQHEGCVYAWSRSIVADFPFRRPTGGQLTPCSLCTDGCGWGQPQGCIGREGTSEAAPEAVRQAVGGGCQSGWGRLPSVTNANEAGTCHQGYSGWA